jgi:acyl phosphate:glycerol-3-phosphate acyltransferase
MAQVILWTLVGFTLGSLPFSVWLGRLFAKQDIRQVGDGNPGSANAWKAGGWAIGLLAVLLDIGKGLAPVLLAQANGVDGWGMLPVALAPIVGHMASPFLGFRGGKALAVTGGVWLALIGPAAFLAYAPFALVALALQTENAWPGVMGVAGFFVYTLVSRSPLWLVAIGALSLALIVWKHRLELRRPIHLRPWAANRMGRRQA